LATSFLSLLSLIFNASTCFKHDSNSSLDKFVETLSCYVHESTASNREFNEVFSASKEDT
jgi:hypothetical protein